MRVKMNKSRMSCEHGRATGPICINFCPCSIGISQPGETQGPSVQWVWEVRARRGLEHIITTAFQKRELAEEEEGASSRSGIFNTNTQTRNSDSTIYGAFLRSQVRGTAQVLSFPIWVPLFEVWHLLFCVSSWVTNLQSFIVQTTPGSL